MPISVRWCPSASRMGFLARGMALLCAIFPLTTFATPCDVYPKPSIRYVGLKTGPVEFSTPYPISSLFTLDPAPAPEMKYFGLAVRKLKSEVKYQVDGVTWTPQLTNTDILFAGLDISGQLIPSNYGTSWSNATITFLPVPGNTSPKPEDIDIRDWTLVYQLVKEGLDPISNDWGCQWGINGSSNTSSLFTVGSDRVTVSPGTEAEVGVLYSGLVDGAQVTQQRVGAAKGPTLYLVPDTTSSSQRAGNAMIVFPRGRPPTLLPNVAWTQGPNKVSVPLRATSAVKVSFVLLSREITARNRIQNDFTLAAKIWKAENLGFTLQNGGVSDVSLSPQAARFADYVVDDPDCSTAQKALEAAFPPRAGEITVYYVNRIRSRETSTQKTSDMAGYACPYSGIADVNQIGGNTVVIAVWSPSPAALAHELGHAVSLAHAEFDGSRNLMWYRPDEDSVYLTEGQTFRANYSPNSVLIKTLGQSPPGGPLYCPASPECPAVNRRVWADGPFPAN